MIFMVKVTLTPDSNICPPYRKRYKHTDNALHVLTLQVLISLECSELLLILMLDLYVGKGLYGIAVLYLKYRCA